MAAFSPYPSLIKGAVRKYFKKEYGAGEAGRLWQETLRIYGDFVS